MQSTFLSRPVTLLLALSGLLYSQDGAAKLPPPKKQPSAKAVVEEHMDALKHCDWNRVMAQYPDNAEFFLPGGQVIKGRQQIGELFRNALKPFNEGGICGITFEPEHTFAVGDTLNVQWKAIADGLAEPYRGSDAYVTKGGYMAAMVTTFDATQLKRKQ
jgi:ketosteroid isomerase-like protein